MKTVGRLKEGDLFLAGEIDERSPSIKQTKIRYIRDWLNGSTVNASSHWVEIQAVDNSGTNVALNKTNITHSSNLVKEGSWSDTKFTDGNTDSTSYSGAKGSGALWVQIDLEGQYEIDEVKVWHYYSDGRTYYDTKTEVSPDGENWYTIFDSAVSGTYAESSAGKTHKANIGGMLSYYPLDREDAIGEMGNDLYSDDKTWSTNDYVDGKEYPLNNTGDFPTVSMEAMIYLEAVPSERYTVLFADQQTGAMYLSVDSNLKVSVYNHLKVSNGYHASNQTLSLNTWYRVTHINTPTETVIMINGSVDRVISNNYDSGTTYLTMNSVRIGAESSTRHFQGKIRNIRMSSSDIRPSSNLHTTLLPFNEGVVVEEGTTNVVPDGDFSDVLKAPYSSCMRGNISIVDMYDAPYGAKALKHEATGSDSYTSPYTGSSGQMSTASEGQTWTLSIWAKSEEEGATAQIYIFPLDSTGSYIEVKMNEVTIGREWAKLEVTHTMPVNTVGIGTRLDNDTGAGSVIYWNGWHLENKDFSTSFVNGSRSSGKLYYPASFSQDEDFTISLKAKYSRGASSTYSSEIDIFCDDTDRWGGQLRVQTADSRLELLLRDLAGTTHNKYTGYLYTPDDGDWHTYTLVSESGYGARLYYDGESVANWSGLYPSYSQISVGRNGMGDSYVRGGMYKDLSVYNRALTPSEVKKLHSNKMSITQDGYLISEVKEKPNSIPSDAKYFPLGDGGVDEHRFVTPREDTLAYDRGVAWAGTETTNNIANYQSYVTDNNSTNMTVTPITHNGQSALQVHMENTDRLVFTDTINWLDVTVTGSFHFDKIQRLDPNNDINLWLFRNGTTTGVSGTWGNYSKSEHDNKRVSITFTETVSDNTTIESNVSLGLVANKTLDFIIYMPQLEQRSYVTPFVDGTRPYTRLNYTYSDILPNYSKFTFGMWVKYMGHSDYELSGDWANWYFGNYRGSYLLFSWKENSVNTGDVVSQRSVKTGTLNIPEGEWVHIACSVVENSSIDIYYNGELAKSWSGSFYINADTPDIIELNSLSETNTAHALNAYVKDVFFVPNSTTSSKIKEIYKTQMRDKDGVQVQSRVIEESL